MEPVTHGTDRERMSPRELECRQVVELVNDYLEGALIPAERVRFEMHLDDCPHCVTYLEQVRATIGLLGRLREESIDPHVRQELLRRFRDWHPV
jgi:anti-sigma factor RsiW